MKTKTVLAIDAVKLQPYQRLCNKSFHFESLEIIESGKQRVCYTCKSLFVSKHCLSVPAMGHAYYSGAYLCPDCARGFLNALSSEALKLLVPLDTTYQAGKPFDQMNITELLAAFKSIPSVSMLSAFGNAARTKWGAGISPIDYPMIEAMPPRLLTIFLQEVRPDVLEQHPQFRDKIILKALRSWGKRNRHATLRIHVPPELLKKLRPLSLLRVLESHIFLGSGQAGLLRKLLFPLLLRDKYKARVEQIMQRHGIQPMGQLVSVP